MIALLDRAKPIHGMSNINESILKELGESKHVYVLNTVPSYAAFLFPGKLWVFIKIFHTIVSYFRLLITLIFRKHKTIYRPINGGSGQIFDVVFFTICKAFNSHLYIHHHSFNYLNDKSRLFFILNKLLGDKTVHVALGAKMKEKLIELYAIPENNIVVLSNLAFFPKSVESSVTERKSKLVIGHLANLSIDKGLDIFIDVCIALKEAGVDFHARVAGPFSSEAEKTLLERALQDLKEIEYVGSVYGHEKQEFFQSLDCFVFPSKYQNEAEPLVLYEAAQFGGLLIGSQRGCMKDVIGCFGGFSFEENKNLAEEIVLSILNAQKCNLFANDARLARINLFNKQKEVTDGTLSQLINGMIQDDIPKS
ncbi:glycosyltransferase family 4 protein [Alteromonas sp. M12]|uniref:glycosyltransferase family 4 protein n=1 Tax=Alteromonas sp. M12 TaxID=3135644 RepID=UPI00319E8551